MSAKRKLFKIIIPLFLVFTLGFGIAATAKAVEFDEDGIVEANEVIDDDLFIGGDTVQIDGTVNGDVIAFGSVVKINGIVNGSLVTGAQSILVDGIVDGSVYAGSSTLTLGSEAEIGRNLYYGGLPFEEDLTLTKLSKNGTESWTRSLANTAAIIPSDFGYKPGRYIVLWWSCRQGRCR